MGKVHTTLTVDEELIAQAKARRINVSGVVNELLRTHLKPRKKDLPEDSLKAFCDKCGEEITKGYICEASKKVWCVLCHNGENPGRDSINQGISMLECKHDLNREHFHQIWGDWEDAINS